MEREIVNSEEKIPRDPIFGPDAPPSLILNPDEVKKSIYRNGNCNPKSEIRNNLEYEIRFRCLQGWFFRCSWSKKFNFLCDIIHLTTGVFVLEEVLKCIDTIYSKDVVDSFARDRIEFVYDIVPTDDNRALSLAELNVVIQEDTMWFLTLNSASQIEVIVTLMKLGGGGLIFNAFKEIDRLYRERKEINVALMAVKLSGSEIEAAKPKDDGNGRQFEVKSQEEFEKYRDRKFEQYSRRNRELYEFRKRYGLLEGNNGKKGNGKKKDIGETVDHIQVLPLWVNRRIMLFLEEKELNELKKTGKYWAKMIEDALRERNGRTAINTKIRMIEVNASEKMADKENDKTCSDLSELSILGLEALHEEMGITKGDLVRIRKESETLKGNKVEVSIWQEMCLGKLCCCCVNDVSKLLALATPSKTVNFYSLRTGAKMNYHVSGLPCVATSLAIHDDGFHILVGCEDGGLMNVNIRKNEKVISYKGHSEAVIHICTSDDKLISASKDNTIKHFDLWSGLCLLCARIDGGIASVLGVKGDGEEIFDVIAGTAEGKLFFIDLKRKKIYGGATVHDKKVGAMLLDRNILITAGSDKTVRFWRVDNLKKIRDGEKPRPYIVINLNSAAGVMDSKGDHIFAPCTDGRLRLICKLNGATTRVIEVTEKKPIMGIYVMQEKDTTKMIMWHEGGIEMRAISFGKISSVKKKGRKERMEWGSERESPLQRRRLFSVLPGSVMHFMAPKSRGIKRFNATCADDKEKVAADRSCTHGALRDARGKDYEVFTQDVFTAMLRKYNMLHLTDNELKTFPRLINKGRLGVKRGVRYFAVMTGTVVPDEICFLAVVEGKTDVTIAGWHRNGGETTFNIWDLLMESQPLMEYLGVTSEADGYFDDTDDV